MKNFLLRVLTWIGGVSRTLAEFLLPLLAQTTATALERLLPAALEIVASLSAANMTGRQKQALAVQRLRNEAIVVGVDAATSLLNLSVEMAVQKLRENSQN